ncbi:MAG: hypothetical protein JRE23_09825, partial [Deltaproteobacteria bacterium]|nr:hypothetical protein [Deltaproteobacteria bacterium]
MILPGELRDPGTDTGKKDDPDLPGDGPISQTAGTEFTITVNSVDDLWNICETNEPQVEIDSTDEYDDCGGAKYLTGGSTYFVITNKVANTTHTITAEGIDSYTDYTENVSSEYEVKPDTT